ERLHGAAGGGGARHGLELREQLVARSRDLHVEVMIKRWSPSSGLWMVCTNPRMSAGCGAEERTSLSSVPVGIATELGVETLHGVICGRVLGDARGGAPAGVQHCRVVAVAECA